MDNAKVEQKWLLSSDGYVDVKVDATARFVKFNVGQFGFYRVNYPKEEWIRFSKVLQEDHTQLSEQTSQIVHDLPLSIKIKFIMNSFHDRSYQSPAALTRLPMPTTSPLYPHFKILQFEVRSHHLCIFRVATAASLLTGMPPTQAGCVK